MIKFYQNLQAGSIIPIALNQAQLWLREITKREIEQSIKKNFWYLNPTLKISLRRRLHKMANDDQPFKEPFHWAAFCAIGV
jgi:CHAT domain-containing protein